jgi:hypothetical protein
MSTRGFALMRHAGFVSIRRRKILWRCVVASASPVVWLAQAGLDAADKLASVRGLFAGLMGLPVSVTALVRDPRLVRCGFR